MGLFRICIYGLPLAFLVALILNPFIPTNERWALIPVGIIVVWILILAWRADRRIGIAREMLATMKVATLATALIGLISAVSDILSREAHAVPILLSYFELVSCIPAAVLAFAGRTKRKR